MTNLLVLLTLLLSNNWATSDSPDLQTVFTDPNSFFELCTGHTLPDNDEDASACDGSVTVSFTIQSIANYHSESSAYQKPSCCLPQSRAPPSTNVS